MTFGKHYFWNICIYNKRYIMNKIITIISLVFITLLVKAQTPIYDSISMGPGYTNAVFYSMQNGTVVTAPIYTSSDIQIRFDGRSASIRPVDGFGAKVFLPVVSSTANWSTIDTTGMTELHNSDTAWENGAYNETATGHPDYGWGMYDNVTHDINGSKIFIHKTASGTYKKVWILKLNSLTKTYYIRHANLDGSMDFTDTIGTSDFPNKNFGYFNYGTRTKVDAEPIGTAWDLVFRKYDRTSDYRSVTGVLSNLNVRTTKLITPDPNTASGSGLLYYTNISIIGDNWKNFTPPTGPWEIFDSTAYFVLDQTNAIWRIVFTGFSGQTSGKAYFTKTKLGTVGIDDINNISLASIYPNPIDNNSILAFTSKSTSPCMINITNTQGSLVSTENINTTEGLNVYDLGNKNLNSGMYFVSIIQNGETHTTRMIVNK